MFGIGNAFEFGKEQLGGVGFYKIHAKPVAERLHDLFGFVLAVQTVIDENADKIFPHRAVHEGCGDGGIDPARHGAQHLFIARARLDLLHLLFDEPLHSPIAVRAAHLI